MSIQFFCPCIGSELSHETNGNIQKANFVKFALCVWSCILTPARINFPKIAPREICPKNCPNKMSVIRQKDRYSGLQNGYKSGESPTAIHGIIDVRRMEITLWKYYAHIQCKNVRWLIYMRVRYAKCMVEWVDYIARFSPAGSNSVRCAPSARCAFGTSRKTVN